LTVISPWMYNTLTGWATGRLGETVRPHAMPIVNRSTVVILNVFSSASVVFFVPGRMIECAFT